MVHDDQSGRRRCHCAADSVERTKRLSMQLNIHVIHNDVPHSEKSITLSRTVAVATRNSVTSDVRLNVQDENMPNEIQYMLQHWLAPLAFTRTRLVESNEPLKPLEHIYYPNGQGSMHHLLVHESFGPEFVAFVLLQLDNSNNLGFRVYVFINANKDIPQHLPMYRPAASGCEGCWKQSYRDEVMRYCNGIEWENFAASGNQITWAGNMETALASQKTISFGSVPV